MGEKYVRMSKEKFFEGKVFSMKQLYKNNPMNQPRMKTDVMFADYDNIYRYEGFVDEAFSFIQDFQLMDPTQWTRFVDQFRMEDADFDRGWRGEYWGKMMRGACFVYSYTKNPELYKILSDTVRDMISTADESGRISAYGVYHEFDGWDIWERKYVLLGMQYFYEICEDEALRAAIVQSMIGQVDYISERIGDPKLFPKKIHITKATRNWRGLNSASLLEPIIRLYTLTGEQRFFDFATYIVEQGGTDVANIFTLAYEDHFAPYQYPVTKAYEMTSCFEGLLEYYRVTGNEYYKTAIINYANRVLETDFTVIGSGGMDHELFDHSTVRQANTTGSLKCQETCVTVTLMKFFYQVHLLTGDPKYIDAFERSLYNGYLGAVNTEKVIEPTLKENHPEYNLQPLHFDSYSPLTAGRRGVTIGGFRLMSDNHYYGCCACIGSAGIGLVPKVQLLSTKEGFALNLYIRGTVESTTPAGQKVTFTLNTEYPKEGRIQVTVSLAQPEAFQLKLRNPAWNKETSLTVCGEPQPITEGYLTLDREWKDGDTLELSLDMRTEVIRPIPYGAEFLMNVVIWGANYLVQSYDVEDPIAHKHIALRRGPVMLAQENRLGYSVDDPVDVQIGEDGYVAVELTENIAPYKNVVEALVPLTNGKKMLVTDYSSAGKLWTEESKMAAWMLTE